MKRQEVQAKEKIFLEWFSFEEAMVAIELYNDAKTNAEMKISRANKHQTHFIPENNSNDTIFRKYFLVRFAFAMENK